MADNADILNALSQELKDSRKADKAPVADAPIQTGGRNSKSVPAAPVGEAKP